MERIQGKGLTPEAAEHLGIPIPPPQDDTVSDEDNDDSGVSGPFSVLTPVVNPRDGEFTVPADMSSGDSISDVGITEDGSGDDAEAASPASSPRSRSRIVRVAKSKDDSRPPRDASSRPPSLDEWQHFFGKIVLRLACDWYLSFAFRGIDDDVVSERDIERLAMTDEERLRISTPLSELSNKSTFMRKHGRKLVATGDAFEAMVTIGAWMSRVNRIASKYRPKTAQARVVPNGNNGSGPPEANGTSYTSGATNGRVPSGYPVYQPGSG